MCAVPAIRRHDRPVRRMLGGADADFRAPVRTVRPAAWPHACRPALRRMLDQPPPPLAAIRACFHYADSARDLILHYKHGDGLQLTPLLARLGARLFIELGSDSPLVIPVPLHRRRYFRRRYNQAAEWARHLCDHTGQGDFAPNLLVRQRPTRSQGGLSRHQRQRNIAGAFAVPPDAAAHIAGRPVLLVDDVLTTGATLHEAARRLTAAGSGPVSALVLARVTRLSHS